MVRRATREGRNIFEVFKVKEKGEHACRKEVSMGWLSKSNKIVMLCMHTL